MATCRTGVIPEPPAIMPRCLKLPPCAPLVLKVLIVSLGRVGGRVGVGLKAGVRLQLNLHGVQGGGKGVWSAWGQGWGRAKGRGAGRLRCKKLHGGCKGVCLHLRAPGLTAQSKSNSPSGPLKSIVSPTLSWGEGWGQGEDEGWGCG